MVGQAKDMVPVPGNDVVDWLDKQAVTVEMYTGTSTIKPGHLVYGSTHIAHLHKGSGNPIGYALYKETHPKYQKADYSSAYDKGAWIAVVPLGTPCRIYAFCGTITAADVGQILKPDGTTAGGVSPMVNIWSGSAVIQAKICGRALAANTSGAGAQAMIEVI